MRLTKVRRPPASQLVATRRGPRRSVVGGSRGEGSGQRRDKSLSIGFRHKHKHTYAGALVVFKKVDLQIWHWISQACAFCKVGAAAGDGVASASEPGLRTRDGFVPGKGGGKMVGGGVSCSRL